MRRQKVTTKKLDKLFSKIIRAEGKCRYCGKTFNLQCAHIVSRRYHQVRWDLNNAIALCAGCHLKFTYDPIGWREYVTTEIMTEEALNELERKAKAYGKIDLQGIFNNLSSSEQW